MDAFDIAEAKRRIQIAVEREERKREGLPPRYVLEPRYMKRERRRRWLEKIAADKSVKVK